MARRWRAPVLAAVGLLGCSGGVPLTEVIRETGPPSVQGPLTLTPIDFRTLDDGTVRGERGHLEVPVRREGGGTGRVSIHFVRLPARAPEPAAPIVYLAGGPGGSGTASAAGDRFPLFDALRDVADVVALDQRGTWNSDPYMVCPGTWDVPLDVPLTDEGLASALEPWVTECHRHWTEQGVELDAFNTRESAADLEALRVALGAEKLNLWAISYGTHLALEFARSFPGSVDRMVLAGIEGPDHTLKSPAAIDATLARADAFFVGQGETPLTSRARRAIERLREGPVTATARRPGGQDVSVTFGELDARIAIFGSAGERANLVELGGALDRFLQGDHGPAAQGFVDWRTGNQGLAMSLAMDCSSWASPERLRRIDAEASASLLGDAANVLTRAQCRSWPGARLDGSYHEAVRSDAPTLFISGALDVRTPPANAEEVAEGFTRAWHLIICDGGHDDDLLIEAPEVERAIADFFRGRAPVERRREVCIGGG
ncbi:MAG TPA: alpha/beta fold hydrolase [Longimicrobiales bacterium]|jgi:pimeloyl-ACP methyl ester carboxylesterase